MRKIVFFFLGIFLCSHAFAEKTYIQTQQQNDRKAYTEQKYQGCGKDTEAVKIASFSTNPPFAWVEKEILNQKGDIMIQYFGKGFLGDVLKKMAEEEKIRARTVGFPSDEEMLAAFSKGGVDMIVGMYYDPKLRGYGHTYLLPSVVQNVISVVFMKGHERDVKSFKDLIGLKGVVRKDEWFYTYVRKQLPSEMTIQEVVDSREAFTKLLTGEVDYMLSSPYSAEAEARRFKMNTDIALVPVPLLGQEMFVLYSANSQCPQFRGIFARKIREKREDMHALKRDLVSYIDKWGQRFKNDPSLAQELGLDKPKETLPGILPSRDVPPEEKTTPTTETNITP